MKGEVKADSRDKCHYCIYKLRHSGLMVSRDEYLLSRCARCTFACLASEEVIRQTQGLSSCIYCYIEPSGNSACTLQGFFEVFQESLLF